MWSAARVSQVLDGSIRGFLVVVSIASCRYLIGQHSPSCPFGSIHLTSRGPPNKVFVTHRGDRVSGFGHPGCEGQLGSCWRRDLQQVLPETTAPSVLLFSLRL